MIVSSFIMVRNPWFCLKPVKARPTYRHPQPLAPFRINSNVIKPVCHSSSEHRPIFGLPYLRPRLCYSVVCVCLSVCLSPVTYVVLFWLNGSSWKLWAKLL